MKAADLIKKFGGIRPMAAKLDIPVTTVQGWKKRDIIPETRYALIQEMAQKHDIALEFEAEKATATVSKPPFDFSLAILSIVAFVLVTGAIGFATSSFWKPPVQRLFSDSLEIDTLKAEIRRLKTQQQPVSVLPVPSILDEMNALEREVTQTVNDLKTRRKRWGKDVLDLELKFRNLKEHVTGLRKKVKTQTRALENVTTQLSDLNKRFGQLSNKVAHFQDRNRPHEALLLAVGQLRLKTRHSASFQSELKSVRALAAEHQPALKLIDRIGPFSVQGVPTQEELKSRFVQKIPDILHRVHEQSQTSIGRQALQKLRRLISIRRKAGLVPGNDVASIVARTEFYLENNDFQAAVSMLQTLPLKSAQTIRPWIIQVQKRLMIEKTLNELTGYALGQMNL